MKFRIWTKKIAIICCISVLLSGCSLFGGDKTESTEALELSEASEASEAEETVSMESLEAASEASGSAEASAELISETYPETEASSEGDAKEQEYFGIMHASITEVLTESNGTTVYTFMDKNDSENVWAIPSVELGDILVDPVAGTDTAILFCGDIISDSENVDFVVMLPEGSYEICRAEGTTTENAMSTFALETKEGEELIFLKDNCEIEEGSLEGDSGDHIIVYYAKSTEDGSCYPFKVYAG
ncbi:MAG TPA: hypothetical protein IAB10_01655 [Candidatus Avilachnospira avistercoris]|nr:hypothetical protein [Candidatus Avilachnospira avistercoris]